MTAPPRDAFRDQSALVTGATGAIGSAVAERLAVAGARVLLSGRNQERLAELTHRLTVLTGPGRVHALAADLAAAGEPERLADRAAALYEGGLDLLVHGLGFFAAARLADAPVDHLDRQLAVNLRAPWALTRALLPALLARRGQVVFVNSSAAHAARATLAAYAGSKAALKALADALRDEVNRDGVRVLSVFPGRTASAMQEEVCRAFGQEYRPERLLQPDDVAEAVLAALALPRTAEMTEIHLRPMTPG